MIVSIPIMFQSGFMRNVEIRPVEWGDPNAVKCTIPVEVKWRKRPINGIVFLPKDIFSDRIQSALEGETK